MSKTKHQTEFKTIEDCYNDFSNKYSKIGIDNYKKVFKLVYGSGAGDCVCYSHATFCNTCGMGKIKQNDVYNFWLKRYNL